MTEGEEEHLKRARGFLLAYSTLVVALWFLEAKVTGLNLMGVSLTLEYRKENVWAGLAALNIWFWFRYFHRLPKHRRHFDNAMNLMYDKALARFALFLKRLALWQRARTHFIAEHGASEKMKIFRYRAYVTALDALEEEERNYGETCFPYELSRTVRTHMRLWVEYKFTEGGVWVSYTKNASLGDYVPSALTAWTVWAYVIVKGAFLAPWFTDRIAPLALGVFSTVVALWKWWVVTFSVAPT